MNASNRAAKLTKSHKVLKKHYKPTTIPDRPVLEHLLYACILENAVPDLADEAFARMQEEYFDWNEVRVTTVAELSEVMNKIPDATEAAQRLKATLQSVFEAHYSFDLEPLKKMNLGVAIKELEKLRGLRAFAIAYATQHGLGGHAIPVSQGAMEALKVVGIVSDAEADKHKVPGMERAIPKTKGVEYASLLHQVGVDFHSAPFSPRVRSILVEIDPDAKERMPKRTSKKKETEAPEAVEAEPAAQPAAKGKKKKAAAKKAAPPAKKKTVKKKASSKAAAPKATTVKKKSTSKRLAKKKPR